jgi:hypothetical protein
VVLRVIPFHEIHGVAASPAFDQRVQRRALIPVGLPEFAGFTRELPIMIAKVGGELARRKRARVIEDACPDAGQVAGIAAH